jgi:hypothetical protein
MTTWDQVYLIYGVFISMVYNDISTLDPSWEDDTKFGNHSHHSLVSSFRIKYPYSKTHDKHWNFIYF